MKILDSLHLPRGSAPVRKLMQEDVDIPPLIAVGAEIGFSNSRDK